ncbi:MAG: lipopolysaccharide heptosyltransferase I [Betaproteobacteria bacterium]|nr:lipopolysaccharide heptosyltransferase I [Betaproteobacteria bacterium]
MKKILLVKTSSLGDVIHNLPVATDVRRHFPDAIIDWVAEEAYAPLLHLHPAVRTVIPVAVRRWRRHLPGPATWREIAEFRRLSDVETYDVILDSQGLLKSAIIARAARGRHHGFDAASARESLAAWFYEERHAVSLMQHAVDRNRALAAAALGYRNHAPIDYGLRLPVRPAFIPAGPYAVLLHGTSRADKLWDLRRWIELGRLLEARGLKCVLPWGDEVERERGLRAAKSIGALLAPDRMPIDTVAGLLAGADAVFGVDTGLTHLAAALGRPTVAIFSATDPKLTGVHGARRATNIGATGLPPDATEVIAAFDRLPA